jgi:hypothetical protein
MIYTAPCVRFLMRADTLRGEVGGGGVSMETWVLWAPVKMQELIGECYLGPKNSGFQRHPPPPTSPRNVSARIKNLTHGAV